MDFTRRSSLPLLDSERQLGISWLSRSVNTNQQSFFFRWRSRLAATGVVSTMRSKTFIAIGNLGQPSQEYAGQPSWRVNPRVVPKQCRLSHSHPKYRPDPSRFPRDWKPTCLGKLALPHKSDGLPEGSCRQTTPLSSRHLRTSPQRASPRHPKFTWSTESLM